MQPIEKIRSAILSALALAPGGCGELYEDEACIRLPSSGVCPSPKQAEKELLGKGCGYKTVSVDGKATIKEPEIDGGYGAATVEPANQPAQQLACCYPVTRRDNPRDGCTPGRPFLSDHGDFQFAALRPTTGWLGPLQPRTEGLSSLERQQLADAWVAIAKGEHASIAAFSKLSLELIRYGAPAHLIQSCHEAALDETRHAQGAFALASAYAGTSIGPGLLNFDHHLSLAQNFAMMARAAAIEGCRDETLAALVVAESAKHCQEPVVRAFLEQVAADETRHAAFSWQVLQWSLEHDPTIIREIDEILSVPPQINVPGILSDAFLTDHGLLHGSQIEHVQSKGLQEIVRPCWKRLRAA